MQENIYVKRNGEKFYKGDIVLFVTPWMKQAFKDSRPHETFHIMVGRLEWDEELGTFVILNLTNSQQNYNITHSGGSPISKLSYRSIENTEISHLDIVGLVSLISRISYQSDWFPFRIIFHGVPLKNKKIINWIKALQELVFKIKEISIAPIAPKNGGK